MKILRWSKWVLSFCLLKLCAFGDGNIYQTDAKKNSYWKKEGALDESFEKEDTIRI